MILWVGLELALVCGYSLHLFLLKSCAIHYEIWLRNMLQMRAKIMKQTTRVVRLARNFAFGQLGVKARVNTYLSQCQVVGMRVKWMRNEHDVDFVQSKLSRQRVARSKIMRDRAIGPFKIHARNAKNVGGLGGFLSARGDIAKWRGLAVGSVDNENAMPLRNEQRHRCAKAKFGIIRMRRDNRNIHGVFLLRIKRSFPIQIVSC